MCKDCNTPSFNCDCIHCMARLILLMDKSVRKYSIVNSRFGAESMEAEVMKQFKEKQR